mgnify:FL=1
MFIKRFCILKRLKRNGMNSKDSVFIDDPYEELLNESKRLGVGVKGLDFTLLGFSTSYTVEDGDKYKTLSEKELVLFNDENIFLNEKLKIRQSYKIKIAKVSPKKDSISSRIKLLRNKDLTKLIAEIDFNGVAFYPNIAMEVLQEIYKKMIKEKFFLGVRVFNFKKELLDALNRFKNKTLRHNKARILLARGVHSISAETEKLTLNYKNKVHKMTNVLQKVSVIGISEGDLILRHTQPGISRKGRSLKLDFIEPHIPPENKIEFSCSENLEAKEVCHIKERACYVEYYAKKNGFVTLTEGKYDIENELNLSSVTFKEFGAVLGGLDKNITVNVKSSSDLEDAVGSGVYIECETLVVNGMVGGNTTLKAKNLKVYGTTSSTSKMYAENAYVSTHRGFVEADFVDIDSLENGYIKAKNIAKVKKTLGGNIRASLVWINSLASNNTITFKQITVIEQCSGTNNNFVIQSVLEEDDNPISKLKELEQRQRQIPSLIENLEETISSSKSGVDKLMKKVSQLQAQKLPIPANFLGMIKQYKDYNHQLSSLNKEESELKIQKEKLIKYLQELDQELFDSRLINKGETWADLNVIKFIFSHTELTYSTKRDEKIKLFYARRDENDKINIEQRNEFEDKDIEWLKESKAQ